MKRHIVLISLLAILISAQAWQYTPPINVETITSTPQCMARKCGQTPQNVCKSFSGSTVTMQTCQSGFYCNLNDNELQTNTLSNLNVNPVEFGRCDICDRYAARPGETCYYDMHCMTNKCDPSSRTCVEVTVNQIATDPLNCQRGTFLVTIGTGNAKCKPYTKAQNSCEDQADTVDQVGGLLCETGTFCAKVGASTTFTCVPEYSVSDNSIIIPKNSFSQSQLCQSGFFSTSTNTCQENPYSGYEQRRCKIDQDCNIASNSSQSQFYQSTCSVAYGYDINGIALYCSPPITNYQCSITQWSSTAFRCSFWESTFLQNGCPLNYQAFTPFPQNNCNRPLYNTKGACFGNFVDFFEPGTMFTPSSPVYCNAVYNNQQIGVFNANVNPMGDVRLTPSMTTVTGKYGSGTYGPNTWRVFTSQNQQTSGSDLVRRGTNYVCQADQYTSMAQADSCIDWDSSVNMAVQFRRCPNGWTCKPTGNENPNSYSIQNNTYVQNSTNYQMIWACQRNNLGDVGDTCYYDKDCWSQYCSVNANIGVRLTGIQSGVCQVVGQGINCQSNSNCDKGLQCWTLNGQNYPTCQPMIQQGQPCNSANSYQCEPRTTCATSSTVSSSSVTPTCMQHFSQPGGSKIVVYTTSGTTAINAQNLQDPAYKTLKFLCQTNSYIKATDQCAGKSETVAGGWPKKCNVDADCPGTNNPDVVSQCQCWANTDGSQYCAGFFGNNGQTDNYFGYNFRDCYPYTWHYTNFVGYSWGNLNLAAQIQHVGPGQWEEFAVDGIPSYNGRFSGCRQQKPNWHDYSPIPGNSRDTCYNAIFMPNNYDWIPLYLKQANFLSTAVVTLITLFFIMW